MHISLQFKVMKYMKVMRILLHSMPQYESDEANHNITQQALCNN